MKALKDDIDAVGPWWIKEDIFYAESLWVCAVISCVWIKVGHHTKKSSS